MDLAGPVAVIEGKLYPLRSCDISRDVQTEDLLNGLGQKQTTVVTGEEISGTVESYRSYEFPHLGAPAIESMYIFPPDGGTRKRLVVRDAIVSGTSRERNNRTQTIEFVAHEIETDG